MIFNFKLSLANKYVLRIDPYTIISTPIIISDVLLLKFSTKQKHLGKLNDFILKTFVIVFNSFGYQKKKKKKNQLTLLTTGQRR